MTDPQINFSTKFVLVFTDIVTSGLDPDRHEVLAVAALRVELPSWEIVDSMSCLVLPTHIETAEPVALSICGYDPERWEEEAHDLAFARAWFETVAQGAGISSHNRAFEQSFLTRWYAPGARLPWTHRGVCTQALSAALVLAGACKSNGLREACEALSIPLDHHHDAACDARASLMIAQRLLTPLAQLIWPGLLSPLAQLIGHDRRRRRAARGERDDE